MGEKEIREFLNYLAVKEKVAASTQNQALCALLFLYKQVLNAANSGNGWEELPPPLLKRFNELVNKRYKGDLAAAISAFLDLHGNLSS